MLDMKVSIRLTVNDIDNHIIDNKLIVNNVMTGVGTTLLILARANFITEYLIMY